jgi:WD40 repeat protein/serine/threonine protein kinase
MPLESVASLVDALRQYRLLEPPQLEEATRLGSQPGYTDPRALARELLQRGWLTAFQVNQIFQGHADELVLGSYVLLERLGEGGMGQVFKARHVKLGKIVALKIIRKDRLNNTEALRRFHREILVAAQLSHPNVVHSYDADQVGDRHLITMEFVDGIDLSRLVRERGALSIRAACEYIRQAALGLQHAHEHGLVHRDIKPSNLLLGRTSGSQSVGLIKLLDLGLARVLSIAGEEAPSELTQAGALVGTPDFIAPEQARNAHTADIRADLYSLGCTFFFVLTGQTVFPGGSMTEKVLKHHWDPAPGVETVRAEVPPIVAAIVRKLLAKRPDDRFQTPAVLAQALDRVLSPGGMEMPVPPEWLVSSLPAAEPVAALPMAIPAAEPHPMAEAILATPTSGTDLTTPMRELPARPIRRSPHRPLMLIGGGFLAVLATLLVAFVWPRGESRPTPNARATFPTQAELASSPLDKLSRDRVPPADRVALQAKEVVAVLGEHRGRHFGAIRAVAIAPDGQSIYSAGDDDVVRIWDAHTLQARGVLTVGSSSLTSMACSADGKLLAAGDYGGTVRLWDLTRSPIRDPSTLRHGADAIATLAFASDNKMLAVALEDRTVQLWDLLSGGPQKSSVLSGHKDDVTALAFSPDSRVLATGGRDRTIRLYEWAGGGFQFREALSGHTEGITSLAFAPKSRTLASAADDKTFRLWDIVPKQAQRGVSFPLDAVASSLTFGPSRDFLICGREDGIIGIYDLTGAKPRLKARLEETTGINTIAWSNRGPMLASGSNGGTVRAWDWNDGEPRELAPPRGHTARVGAIAFAPDGQSLATGGDETVRLWDMNALEPKELAALNARGTVTSLAYTPDGKRLAAGSRFDPLIRLWELPATVPRTWPMAPDDESRAAAVAFLNNRTLVTGGRDTERTGTIRLWDIAGSEPQPGTVLRGHTGQVGAVVPFKSGERLATGGGVDQTVRIWDIDRKRELHQFLGLKGGIVGPVAISPDGNQLVYASASAPVGMGLSSYVVHVWDLAAQPPKQLPSLPGHTTTVRAVAFAPDGKLLATADDDGRLILWEAATGKNLNDWKLSGAITSLAFAPDSRHLAVGNGNGTAYIMRLKPAPRRP